MQTFEEEFEYIMQKYVVIVIEVVMIVKLLS